MKFLQSWLFSLLTLKKLEISYIILVFTFWLFKWFFLSEGRVNTKKKTDIGCEKIAWISQRDFNTKMT